MTTSPFTHVIEADVPAVASPTSDDTITGQAPYACTVTRVEYVPETAITGADTNTRTLSLVNKGQAGSGSTTVATLALTNGVTAGANNERALTLSGTPANLVLAPGDTLLWRSVHTGTGIADPGGLVRIHLNRTYS